MNVDFPCPDGPMLRGHDMGRHREVRPLQDEGVPEPRLQALDVDPGSHDQLSASPSGSAMAHAPSAAMLCHRG